MRAESCVQSIIKELVLGNSRPRSLEPESNSKLTPGAPSDLLRPGVRGPGARRPPPLPPPRWWRPGRRLGLSREGACSTMCDQPGGLTTTIIRRPSSAQMVAQLSSSFGLRSANYDCSLPAAASSQLHCSALFRMTQGISSRD